MKDRTFIANIPATLKGQCEAERPGVAFADPIGTARLTVDELKTMGYVGLYSPCGEAAEPPGPDEKKVAPAKVEVPLFEINHLVAHGLDFQSPKSVRAAAAIVQRWLDT